MADDYEYDVFISYSHKHPVLRWVQNHFHPELESWLKQSMSYDPKVYIDWKIETGADWPLELRRALKISRCMVSVWSPTYFRSKWCNAEWESMLSREKKLGFRTEDNPRGLIYPVKFFDGELFPDKAKRTQQIDLVEWNNPHTSFRDTNRYDRFINTMQQIAKELAELISFVPPWQKDFQVIIPEQYQKPKGLTKLPKLK